MFTRNELFAFIVAIFVFDVKDNEMKDWSIEEFWF
jgi:hypothetical protein